MAIATNRGLDIYVRGQLYRSIAGKPSTAGLDFYVRGRLFGVGIFAPTIIAALRRRRSRLAMPIRRNGTLIINQNANTSTAFDCQGLTAFGLLFPSSMTGTSCTVTVSADNVTYADLYDDSGSQVTCAVNPSTAVTFATELLPWRYMKIITNQNQSSARTIEVVASSS